MERDFLGIGVKDPAVMETGFLGSSTVGWPFSNNIPAMQQFMNTKVSQDERTKRFMFDQLPLPGLQLTSTGGILDAAHRSPQMLVPQRYLGADRHGIQQFQQLSHPATVTGLLGDVSSAYHSYEMRMFPAVSPHCIPVVSNSPFLKVSGSTNGSKHGVTPMKQQQPFIGGCTFVSPGGGYMAAASSAAGNLSGELKVFLLSRRGKTCFSGPTAQLTIFYGGMVNVYDDVPVDRAQAVMFLAANGSNMSPNAVRVHKPVASLAKAPGEVISMCPTKDMKMAQKQKHAIKPCINQCPQVSNDPQGVAQTGNRHSSTNDLIGTRASEPSLEPPSAAAAACESGVGDRFIPKAIPQARKASIARFLEKRKERVTMDAPYPPLVTHKSPDEGASAGFVFDGKSMAADSAHSTSEDRCGRSSSRKKMRSSSSSSSPSTEFEI